MERTLKKIDFGSAVRIGTVIGIIGAAIGGLLLFGFQGAILTLFAGSMRGFNSDFSGTDLQGFDAFAGLGVLGLCCGWIGFIVAGAIGGAIQGGLFALLYNIAANWVGGVKLTFDGGSDEPDFNFGDEKPKRSL